MQIRMALLVGVILCSCANDNQGSASQQGESRVSIDQEEKTPQKDKVYAIRGPGPNAGSPYPSYYLTDSKSRTIYMGFSLTNTVNNTHNVMGKLLKGKDLGIIGCCNLPRETETSTFELDFRLEDGAPLLEMVYPAANQWPKAGKEAFQKMKVVSCLHTLFENPEVRYHPDVPFGEFTLTVGCPG